MDIALAIMMRDELPRLRRLVDSVDRVNLCSKTVVLDTGSTDGSPEFFADRPNTEVYSAEWKGFGRGRTELMKHAHQKADWILTLDCDDVLVLPQGPEVFLQWLEKQTVPTVSIAYIFPKLKYYLPRIMSGRTETPWEYKGAAHEWLLGKGESGQTDLIHMTHVADGACSSHRLERNLELLLQDAKEDPDNGRTAFYIANTYSELGKRAQAVKWYEKRLMLGGWEEETYCAMLYRARCLESIPDLMMAYQFRPTRAEALISAAKIAQKKGDLAKAVEMRRVASGVKKPTDRLFVETSCYTS